jgi:hypothetical protein
MLGDLESLQISTSLRSPALLSIEIISIIHCHSSHLLYRIIQAMSEQHSEMTRNMSLHIHAHLTFMILITFHSTSAVENERRFM